MTDPGDPDNDELSDRDKINIEGIAPRDTDGEGISDSDENAYGTDPLEPIDTISPISSCHLIQDHLIVTFFIKDYL